MKKRLINNYFQQSTPLINRYKIILASLKLKVSLDSTPISFFVTNIYDSDSFLELISFCKH
jgi:hypothetical protein